MEKILNGLDWIIYSDDFIDNKIYLNKNELLYRFSQMDFNNIYIDSSLLVKLDSGIFNSNEFNINYNDSVYASFFDYANKLNIPLIYNGYHLKNILLNIAYNFSKCSIPFDMVFKVEKWSQANKTENDEAAENFAYQKFSSFKLLQFNYFFNSFRNLFDELKNNPNYYILFRVFVHYCQLYLDLKDMLFLLNNKGNHNLIKHQIASKYLNLNFYTIKLFVHHALFIINELLANGKNSLKQKIEEFIACFNELNVYFLNEETEEYTIFKRKDFVKHNGKEYRLKWSEQMENPEYNQEHFEDQQYVYDESNKVNENLEQNHTAEKSDSINNKLNQKDVHQKNDMAQQDVQYNEQFISPEDNITDINDDRLYEINLDSEKQQEANYYQEGSYDENYYNEYDYYQQGGQYTEYYDEYQQGYENQRYEQVISNQENKKDTYEDTYRKINNENFSIFDSLGDDEE